VLLAEQRKHQDKPAEHKEEAYCRSTGHEHREWSTVRQLDDVLPKREIRVLWAPGGRIEYKYRQVADGDSHSRQTPQ
jgi:hypothetical protein